MNAKNYIKLVCLTVAATLLFEMSLLAGVETVSERIYQTVHLLSMGVLITGQILLLYTLKANNPDKRYIILATCGLISTGIGDYVNSSLSAVTPVSSKLTFALLVFGIGYVLYIINLCSAVKEADPSRKIQTKYVLLLSAVVLMINMVSWNIHLVSLVEGFFLFSYGGFVFNVTIYVAMPVAGVLYGYKTGWSIPGWIIIIASFFLPYSDLILFDSWLVGNPDYPARELYAFNWVIYFGGQCLMSLLPAFMVGFIPRKEALC